MTTDSQAYIVVSCVFGLPSNSRTGRKTARVGATFEDQHNTNVAAMDYIINIIKDYNEQIELSKSVVPDSVEPDSLAAFFRTKLEFNKARIEYSIEGRIKLYAAIRLEPH